MSGEPTTSSTSSNTRSAHLAGPDASVRLVTTIVGIVVGLTFLFGFGNVATLGVRLGVPTYVAFLVAPAVDFSVVALLLGTRHLALHDGPAEVLRSARRLLVFSSTVTLALNVAEPLISGHYGKAAFDAVGPLLLIGWAEVAPGLLHAMQTTEPNDMPTGPATGGITCRSAVPTQAEPAGHSPGAETRPPRKAPTGVDGRARTQDLLHRARAEDVLHWQQHQRPISAETLRRRLHVGTPVARRLVADLRSDTHAKIEDATVFASGGPPQAR